MSDRVDIDERYTVEISDGKVTLYRHGEKWLEDPPAAKAWISALYRIQELEEEQHEAWASEGSSMNPATFTSVAEAITEKLANAWGWLPDEPEAVLLGRQLAEVLHLATRDTRTRPEVLLEALIHPRN